VLRPTATPTSMPTLEDRFANLRIASPMAANAAVEGRRYATVKAQGAYKLKDKKTIPKKLGAKKTGGTLSSFGAWTGACSGRVARGCSSEIRAVNSR
jgi:hypothetical protein